MSPRLMQAACFLKILMVGSYTNIVADAGTDAGADVGIGADRDAGDAGTGADRDAGTDVGLDVGDRY